MGGGPLRGGNGENGNGGSSGGTSDGSSANTSSQPDQTIQQLQRLRATYREMLRRWGIPPSKNMLNLIEKAVRGMWTSTQFIDRLRHTPEYRDRFRGIRWKDGMTEGTYLATYAQYRDRAKDIGVMLTKEDFAKLLKRGIGFDEFSDRVDALQSIDQYGPLWQQFQDELEAAGVRTPGGTLSKKELADFIMGMGSKQWETIYQRAFVITNLEKVAGVEVIETAQGEVSTPDSYEVTRGDVLAILRSVEALSAGRELEKQLTSTDFAALGQRLRQFDINYLRRYGLAPKDILSMELGGPNAAKIAEKAERILSEQEAFFAPRANTDLAQELTQQQGQELPQSL